MKVEAADHRGLADNEEGRAENERGGEQENRVVIRIKKVRMNIVLHFIKNRRGEKSKV